MNHEEIRNRMRDVVSALEQRDNISLMGIATEMMVRLVAAQEAIVEMAAADLEAQVEEAIKSRAETRAEEIVADKSKRSFIGKK